jgi:hypothetical protein
MNNSCCQTCFSICDPLISCFETLLVYLPIGYADETVKIRIGNGQNHITYQTSEVIGGTHIQIDLDNTLIPEGFFSPYGGPYQISFFNPSLQELYFVALDGKTYNCISFTVAGGSTDETVAFVNAFYNELPQGY